MWKRQNKKTLKIFAILVVSIGTYLTFRIKNYEHVATVILPKVHPNEAWEFVADFSNMKYLNPTIENFNIIEESGNYEHWKYVTEYKENLSHWPYLPNYTKANFNIRQIKEKNTFLIHSVHITCLFGNILCLNSESEFKFLKSNKTEGAFCEEFVNYQCPAFMSSFCEREVIHQRKLIMNNLKKHFLTKLQSKN